MKIRILQACLGGACLLGAVSAAQAWCVTPVGFPPNDVNLELPAEVASATTLSVELDMNGVQRGTDEQNWATHGTMLILVPPTGGPPEWIASWTKNTFRVTEEWVCRMKPDATGAITGTGMFHTVDHITPSFATPVERCSVKPADC